VRDYGHKSLRSEAKAEREKTPDFSKRPGNSSHYDNICMCWSCPLLLGISQNTKCFILFLDKYNVDMKEIDPTYVPRGERYCVSTYYLV